MTISTTSNRKEYTGNGSTTIFAYDFLIFEDSDLKVYVDSVLQTLTTHYTVSGEGEPSGGNVTFLAAPGSGTSVVIWRDVPKTQTTDYVGGEKFSAETHETALDRLTVITQQLQDDMDRCIKLAKTVTDAGNVEMDYDASDRASKYFGFDSSGELTIAQALGTWKGLWATTTAYVVGDMAYDGAGGANTLNVYYCAESHTSGVWATDLGAGKWTLAIDIETITTDAEAAQAAAEAAQAAAEAAQTAAETAETNAETAETNATTQAGNAATSASNASTSASQADTAKTAAQAAQTAAEAAQTAAETAQTNAETAETNAETAETNAETAQAAAEAARDLALAYAEGLFDYPSADHTGEGFKDDNMNAGEAITIMDALYMRSDGEWGRCDADAEATMPCLAVALEAGTDGNPLEVLHVGLFRDDTYSFTPGGLVFVSTTTGAFTQTAPSGSGDIVQAVGVAVAASVIFFKPDYGYAEIA